jgi:hypothetical protein
MEGEHEGKEGKIASDYKDSEPDIYEATFDDGSKSGWLSTKQLGVQGWLAFDI